MIWLALSFTYIAWHALRRVSSSSIAIVCKYQGIIIDLDRNCRNILGAIHLKAKDPPRLHCHSHDCSQEPPPWPFPWAQDYHTARYNKVQSIKGKLVYNLYFSMSQIRISKISFSIKMLSILGFQLWKSLIVLIALNWSGDMPVFMKNLCMQRMKLTRE